MSDPLLLSRDGAVAIVSVNDAPMNRMTLDFVDQLESIVDDIAGDRSVRSVVLTAEGEDNFSVGMNLKHDLLPRGIAVGLLHPGLVATELTGGVGITPKESAEGLIKRIDDLNIENSGGFWHAEGYTLPW